MTALSRQFLGLIALAVATHASHDFNENPTSQYTFTQNVSLDLEDINGPVSSTSSPTASSLPVLCSTLICDDEFLISAMMISGGDIQPPSSSIITKNLEEPEDDDDDDDDDGHSSMLSNISLQRSLTRSLNRPSHFVHDGMTTATNMNEQSMQSTTAPAFVISSWNKIRRSTKKKYLFGVVA